MNPIKYIIEISAFPPFVVLIIALIFLYARYMLIRRSLSEKGVTPETLRLLLDQLALQFLNTHLNCCTANANDPRHLPFKKLDEIEDNDYAIKVWYLKERLLSICDAFFNHLLVLPALALVSILVAAMLSHFRETQHTGELTVFAVVLTFLVLGTQESARGFLMHYKSIIDKLKKCTS